MLRSFAQSARRASSNLRSVSVRAFSTNLFEIRDTEFTRAAPPFEFTKENQKKIKEVLAKFPPNQKASGVIPLLYLAQEQNNNWVPVSAMNRIAQLLGVPPIRVYEVATFYTMFNRKPVGKYHLQLCGTVPCSVCGSDEIKDTISKKLKIKLGETTKDGLFTLTEVECLGACVNAPMMQINNKDYYEFLTPQNVTKLLDDLAAGKPVKVGNQNNVKTCEGPQGQTTLLGPEVKPGPCRDFAALKKGK